jgi:hypothetical protein
VVAAKAHPSGVSVVLESGAVQWRPLRPGVQRGEAVPCSGLPAGAIAAAVYDAAAPGKLHVASAEGGLAVLTGAMGIGQRCRASVAAQLGSETAALALAAVPGYVLAVLTPGALALVNVSTAQAQRAVPPLVVLRESLSTLGHGFELPARKAFAPRDLRPSCSATQAHGPPPLLAAAAAAAAPGVSGSNALVVLQLGPRVVGMYAAVLPYRSPPPPGTTPLAWLKVVQPLMLAGVVAVVVVRTRGKSSSAAAVKSMEQLAHSLGAGAARPRWASMDKARPERRGRQVAAQFDSDGSDGALGELNRLWNEGDDGDSSGDQAAPLLQPGGNLSIGF